MERSEVRGADDGQGWGDDERPDPVERLDEATAALEALREGFSLAEPLSEILKRLADSATRAIPDADGVTITVLTDDGVYTAAATEEHLIEIDQVQYTANRGPCLQAATTREAIRAVVGEHHDAWPEFETAARRLGMCAYLSVPLLVTSTDGDRLVGSLNMYSVTASAFDPFDESLMRLFTTAVCAAITSSQLWQDTRNRLTQLETAMHSRAEIEQAKGMFMAVHGCSADEAFAMLVERSQTQNTKLREVVRSMLASVRKS